MNSEPLTFENLRAGIVIAHANVLRDRRRGPFWRVLSIKEVPNLEPGFARVHLRNIFKEEYRVVEFRIMRGGVMCLLQDKELLSYAIDRVLKMGDTEEVLADAHALKLQLPSHAQEALAARERLARKRRARIADEFWQGSDKRPRSRDS